MKFFWWAVGYYLGLTYTVLLQTSCMHDACSTRYFNSIFWWAVVYYLGLTYKNLLPPALINDCIHLLKSLEGNFMKAATITLCLY